jgi:xanthine/CO dehydrogenase XdhC/CoxF family maturation factor
VDDFFALVNRMQSSGEAFAIATVIAVRGSASAKPGSKAIIDAQGNNIFGWVGGGCAETFVAQNALEAMKEGQTRIVQADLDDEVFGLGMPCGGVMDVFIDPQGPPAVLSIKSSPEAQAFVIHLARRTGFIPQIISKESARERRPIEDAIYEMAAAIAEHRKASFHSLRSLRGIPWNGRPPTIASPLPELLIVGSSRITEELAWMGSALGWPTRVYGWNFSRDLYASSVISEEFEAGFKNFHVKQGSAVIIASHHKGDPTFIAKAHEAGAAYIGMVASEKRSKLVAASLKHPEHLFAPSGLDLNCRNPIEIALSIIAEIILFSQRS